MLMEQYSVLILNDSPEACKIYHSYLIQDSFYTYDIFEAKSAKEAFFLFEQQKIDVIILDYELSNENGLEIFKQLKEASFQIPVVMIFSQENKKMAFEAINLGAEDYLIYPQLTEELFCRTVRGVLKQAVLKREIDRDAKQGRFLREISLRMSQLDDLKEIIDYAVVKIRELIKADRVIIYQFDPQKNGQVVSESVLSTYSSCLSAEIDAVRLWENRPVADRLGCSLAISDIYRAGLTTDQIKLLEQFQVKAHLVVPLLVNQTISKDQSKDLNPQTTHNNPESPKLELWGLIMVHQCSASRQWQKKEIASVEQIGLSLSIAIQQASTYKKLQQAVRCERSYIEEQKELILHWKPDRTVLFVNEAYSRFYGKTQQEILGQDLLSIVHESVKEFLNAELPKIISRLTISNPTSSQEHWLVDAKGKLHYYHWSDRGIFAFDGSLIEIQSVGRDITERKQVEIALEQEVQRRKTIFNTSVDGMYILDQQGRLIEANASFARMLGYTPEELVKLTVFDWNAQLSKEKITELLSSTVFHHEIFETLHRRRDGSLFEVEISVGRLDLNGKLAHLCVARDISERKQSERMLSSLMAGTAAVTGEDFFPALVYHVAQALNVSYAMVTELIGDELHTLAFCGNGKLQPSFSYKSALTPCELTLREGEFYCESFVQAMFPHDLDLVEMQADSYLGVSLKDNDGKAIGNLCILDVKPLSDLPRLRAILQVFAARAAAELERQKTGCALRELNQSLEARVKQRTLELQQRERDLHNLSERLALAIKSAQIGIWEWDISANQIIWDKRMYELYGIEPTKEATSYESWLSLVHPEDRNLAKGAIEEALAGEKEFQVEFRVVHPDGSVKFIKAYSLLQRYGEGNNLKMIGVNFDISERKQIELAIRNSEANLLLAQKVAHIGSWEWDLATGKITWSEGLYQIFRKDPETFDLNYSALVSLVHPEDRPALEEAVNQAIAQGRNYQIEYRIILSDESIRYIEVKAEVIVNQQNQAIKIFGAALDITDRKIAEIKIQQVQAKYRNLIEQIHGVVYVSPLIPNHEYAYISPQIYSLLGVPQEEWQAGIFNTWMDYVHPEDRDRVLKQFQTPLIIGQSFHAEYRMIGRDGRIVWIRDSACLTLAEDNATLVMQGIAVDITERKLIEESLNQLNLELEQRVKERTAKLEESEARLLEAQQVAHLGSWQYDFNSKEIIWSPEMFRIFKLDPSLGVPSYEQILQHFPKDVLEPYIKTLTFVLDLGQPDEKDLQIIRADGSFGYIFLKVEPIYNPQGQIIKLFGIVMDITERKEAEIALRESEERYATLAAAAPVAIYRVDLNGSCIYVNDYWSQMSQRAPQEALGWGWFETIHPEDLDRIRSEFERNLKLHDLSIAEGRFIRPDGSTLWFYSRMLPEINVDGTIIGYLGTLTDITALKQAQAQIVHNSLHDPLTGLPNRTLLLNRLELAINRALTVKNYFYAVLFIDLDRFKVINDSLGHMAGDQVLINITDKLKTHLKKFDLIARLGGDEFVILLEDISTIEQVIAITDNILTDCQTPLRLNQQEIFITLSIGIVFGTKNYTKAADLLRDADIAMYRAKAQGKNCYKIFDAEMHTHAVNRLTLESDLRKALERDELTVYYQPILDIFSYQLIGFEALVRWQHPSRGFISPNEFVPLAEETGLIVAIDRWMFKAACTQMAAWKSKFGDRFPLKISINLCAEDLRQASLIEDVKQTMALTGLEGECIALEITESMLIDNIRETIDLLRELKALNIQISIDDFGTGYSSLNYLHHLPADNLKIDHSFVSKMCIGNPNYQVISTIITLSNQLGLAVVAEGIETSQQLQWLQQLGCEFGQGYLFSKPRPAHEIEKYYFNNFNPHNS